jgi:putative flippase GtrA
MQPSTFQEANAPSWAGRFAFFKKLFGYTGVSALALCLDFAIYSWLIFGGINTVLAAALGYLSGLAVSYVFTRSLVFKSKRVGKEAAGEALGFAMTGIVGLAITSGVVAICTHVFDLGPSLAKLAAVGFSFTTVFLMRSQLVFGPRS